VGGTRRGASADSRDTPVRGRPGSAGASRSDLGAIVSPVGESLQKGVRGTFRQRSSGSCAGPPESSLKWSLRVTAGAFAGLPLAPSTLAGVGPPSARSWVCLGVVSRRGKRVVSEPQQGRLAARKRVKSGRARRSCRARHEGRLGARQRSSRRAQVGRLGARKAGRLEARKRLSQAAQQGHSGARKRVVSRRPRGWLQWPSRGLLAVSEGRRDSPSGGTSKVATGPSRGVANDTHEGVRRSLAKLCDSRLRGLGGASN
jgi:hypothetical protein